MALDPKGRAITDLRSGEVSLTVDGERVRSDMFEKSENAPVSFTILLDASGRWPLPARWTPRAPPSARLVAHRRRGDDFSLFVFAESMPASSVPFTEESGRDHATLSPTVDTVWEDGVF